MNSRLQLLGRWILGIIGISIMSVGIALVTQANLGTTAISALPLVMSYVSDLSFGQTTLLLNAAMFLLEVVLLRKNFKWAFLLQIPMTILFASLLDVSMQNTMHLKPDAYWQSLMLNVIGNAVLAFGISLEVTSDILLLPGEGAVWSVAFVTKKPFPNVKIANDVTLVSAAVVLSFVCLASLQGVREGTMISAILVGFFVKIWLWLIQQIKQRVTG